MPIPRIIAQDDFSTAYADLDGDPLDIGGNWSLNYRSGGTGIIQSTGGYATSGGGTSGQAYYRAGTAVSGDANHYITNIDQEEDAACGVWVRGTATNTLYRLDTGSAFSLQRVTAGAVSLLASSTTPSGGSSYKHMLNVTGSNPTTLKVCWSATAVPSAWNIETTDNTSANQTSSGGSFGIVGQISSSADFQLDDYKVETLGVYRVQSLGGVYTTSTAVNPLVLSSINKTVTVGNKIIVALGRYSLDDDNEAFTDNLGNTYTKIRYVYGAYGNLSFWFYGATVTTGGTLTSITCTWPETKSYASFIAEEWANVGEITTGGEDYESTTVTTTGNWTDEGGITIPAYAAVLGAIEPNNPSTTVEPGSASGTPSTTIYEGTGVVAPADPTITFMYTLAKSSQVTGFIGTATWVTTSMYTGGAIILHGIDKAYAQAQASIFVQGVKYVSAQAQSRIKGVTPVVAQAHAWIKSTYPKPLVNYALDSFSRTVPSGWGTADIGGTWSLSGTAFSVNGSKGLITVTGSNGASANLQTSVDSDSTVSWGLDKLPEGASTYLFIMSRGNGSTYYECMIAIAPAGSFTATIRRYSGGWTNLAFSGNIDTYSVGQVWKTKFRVHGNKLQAKVWNASSTEPASWLLETIDSTITTGDVSYLYHWASSITNAPLAAIFDDYLVTSIDDGATYAQAQAQITSSAATTYRGYAQTQAKIIVPSNNYEKAVFSDNPVFLLTFEEASGNLTDLIAGLTATVSGTPTYGAGGPIQGKSAIGMSASTQYFTVNDHDNLDLGNGPFTLEYWVARDTDTGVWQIVLNKGTNGYSSGIGSASDSLYSDRYTLGKRGIAVIGYNSSATVPANSTFHHVVITRTGTGGADTHKIYVDGVEKTWAVYASGNTVSLDNTTDGLEIGREGSGSTLSGKLAYVALYKKILSSTQVSTHYNAGILKVYSAQAQAQIAGTNVYKGYAQASFVISGDYTSVADTFNRTVSPGWGTADVGGTWGHSDSSKYSTVAGIAKIKGGANSNAALTRTYFDGSVEINGALAITATPTGNISVRFVPWTGTPWYDMNGGAYIQYVYASGGLVLALYDKNNVGGFSGVNLNIISSYVIGDTYSFKIRLIFLSNKIQGYGKLWKLGDSEPTEWNYSALSDALAVPPSTWFRPGHFTVQVWIAESDTDYIALNEINAFEWKAIEYPGQAQAQIKRATTYSANAQAQSRIKQTYRGYGQAQALIKTTYRGYGQTRAQIKQTYRGFAQAQITLRAQTNYFANAMVLIYIPVYLYPISDITNQGWVGVVI